MSNLLNWPHWVIDLVEENDHDYRISAHLLNPPAACIFCGTVGELRPYGVREQRFMDLPIHAKRVGILVGRRRFKCHSCGRISIEPLADMDETHRMTKRLVAHIQRASLNHTFTDVADTCDIDERTVRLIFEGYKNALEKVYTFETPAVLGIDELHLIGQPRCILTNVEQRTIIDLLEKRDQKTVQKYLSELKDGHKVEVVTMDMWRPYRLAVQATLPNAMVVVDKFHIVRMANIALDKVRKDLRESLSDKKRRQLKRDRYILLHRRKDLDDKDLFILDTWTKNFPELGQAYELKEDFFKIWDELDKQAAWDKYLAWKAGIPADLAAPFKEITTAVENWREPIFNYFDTRVTNAYTETLNGLAKIANRLGRGYSFPVIRAKLWRDTMPEEKPDQPRLPEQEDLRSKFGPATDEPVVLFYLPVNMGADIATWIKTIDPKYMIDFSTKKSE